MGRIFRTRTSSTILLIQLVTKFILVELIFMVFELAKMASIQKRQAQSCHQQPECLTACLVLFQSFFYRVAESEFRTQPIAKAVSATGGVDTVPAQTQANAHFFSYMHHSASSAHFQCGHTALAQGEKEFVSRIRLHSFPSRLTCC